MQEASMLPSHKTAFAVGWIPVLAYGSVLTMPAFLAVLGKYYGMTSSELGNLASAEWLVCIAGTYFCNSRSIQQLTNWVVWTCMFGVVIQVAAVFLAGKVPMIYFHPLSTLGAGIAYGYALKVFDASGEQQRNYGIFLAVLFLSELLVFQLANFLTDVLGHAAIFIVYAVSSMISVGLTLGLRKSLHRIEAAESSTRASVRKRPKALVLAGVTALGIGYVAFGMTWPFVQLMGVARGLTSLDVTNGSSAYSVTGIFGALAAAALPMRFNRSSVLALALVVLLASLYMIYLGPSVAWFIIGCGIVGFYWTFYCATHVSLIARSDDTGRAIVFCGIAPSIGAIIGSFWGGRLVAGANYLPTAELGCVLAVVGIAMTLWTLAAQKNAPGSGTLAAASNP